MKQPPFFSIVLPTKNRSYLVGTAIQSVLNQHFEDFELVIVDNDDTDATRHVINQFDDGRIQYLRTGGFSMADNWNHGFENSKGEYTLIMGDKYVLKKHALARIYQTVQNNRYPVVIWMLESFEMVGKRGFIKRSVGDRGIAVFHTQPILEEFTRDVRPNTIKSRAYNSATHRSVINQMLTGGAKKVSLPVAPDYTLIYQQMAYSETFVQINESLMIATNAHIGTGYTYASKSNMKVVNSFLQETGSPTIFSSHVPIKNSNIEYSLVFNDYLRVRELVQGRLTDYDLSLSNYFRACLWDIARRAGYFQADMTTEMQAWEEVLAQQPQEVRSTLNNWKVLYWRWLIRWLGFRIARGLFAPIRNRLYMARNGSFKHVLDALEWEDRNRESRL